MRGQSRQTTKETPRFLSFFWLPALAFLTLPIYEIRRALMEHNYVQKAAVVHDQTLNALSAFASHSPLA